MSEKLSLLDNSSDSEVELTINKSYATSYDVWRNKEELQKYKDLKKEEEDSESSSESEVEVPEFDEEFLTALSLVKGKDPRIYDKNFELFRDKEIVKKPKTVKEKPMYMKDYERNLVLERGGKFSDEDDDDEPVKVPTYNEELENLKKSFKEAVGDSDVEDDDDDLLQVRTKTRNEEETDEANYVKWLKGEDVEVSDDVKQKMSHLKNYWTGPKLSEDDKFLRDYILNKKYLEKDDAEIPTYEELTGGMLSDDEKMVEEQEKFEHKYNFRFEEPDEDFIKRYPRTVGDSLRKTDNRRKDKREEIAERKKKEREQRREELKRLKALKRKEIEDKFMKLKEISGRDEINLDESDIESDFDPDKHDRKMGEMFNDEYYQIEEQQKPDFPYDEELDSENWNAWSGEQNDDDEKPNDKQENNEESSQDKLNINARDEFANEMINASLPKKKVKKKSLFAKIISRPKPVYDPDGKSFEQYLDEYYKLDYEDIVGDMPVRYKYRKVVPNDFGLTVDEILAADEKELNRWCSVKKTCQYRNEEEEMYDLQAFRKKAENILSKKKNFPSIYTQKKSGDDSDSENTKKNTKYEEIKNVDNSVSEMEGDTDLMQCIANDGIGQVMNKDQDCSTQTNEHKKKSKKKKQKQTVLAIENYPEQREGIDSDVSRYLESSSSMVCDENEEQVNEDQESSVQSREHQKKSKKKKRKVKQDISVMKTESEYCNVINETAEINSDINRNDSSKLEESNFRKSSKRKRECGEVSFSVDDLDSKDNSDDNILSDKFSPKSKQKRVSHSNDSPDTNSDFLSLNVSEVPSKKKKKKKNKRKENDTFNKDVEITQRNKSNPFHNKFSDKKHKQYVSEDKRLGLSDERLTAYGINAKKFKNKIKYSKK